MKGIKKFTANVVMGANVASIVVMLLVGYSGLLDPEQHPVLSCLELSFPVFLVINLCFLIFWAVVSLKRVVVPLLGFIVGFSPVRTYCPLNIGSGEEPDIRLLSYNTGGFSLNEDGVNGSGLQEALDYVKQGHADVSCLQETSMKKDFRDKFKDVYPYCDSVYHKQGHNSIVVLSKYPILRKERINYESSGNLSGAFWLDVNGRQLIVISNHLESVGLSIEERSDFRDMVHGEQSSEGVRKDTKRLLVKLAERNVIRARQVRVLSNFIRQQKGVPVILCGDFNTSPLSYPCYKFSEQLTDCYRQRGNGLGWTFCRDAIRVRIDHVFCSEELTPVSCEIDKSVSASDHYPVICGLKWSENTQK